MLSPSVPELSLRTETNDGCVTAVVEFIGFFGDGTPTSEQWGKYRRIEVGFENVLYARLFPEFSTEDQERIDGYDWSAVPEFRDEKGGFAGSVERSRAAWSETMVCPSPSSYSVLGSDLVRKLGLNDAEFMHFLFLGDDFNVEVIAKDWTWCATGEALS